jgi:type IV pilus assembly protein PilC
MNLVINKIIGDVEGGTAFSKALSRHPEVFDRVFTGLIQAGETSGTLGESLERLADQQEKDAEIRSKVKGALVYPAIVLFVISMVIVFMLTTVLPQVKLLYEDLDQELPFVTATMLSISDLIINFWWLMILIIVAGGLFLTGLSSMRQSSVNCYEKYTWRDSVEQGRHLWLLVSLC